MEASGVDDPLTSFGNYVPEFPQKDIKGLWIFGESESKRRVILIERENGSYGFTLQSYGVRYKHGNRGDTDFITYVNAVEKSGAAQLAGLREGDVILSINGQNMARVEHKSLVTFIRQCPSTLKMVVVSDERARKVELHMRFVHLQKKLQDKLLELEELNRRERQLLARTVKCTGNTGIGGPCLSSVCCFCPQSKKTKEEFRNLVVINPGPSTATISILKPNSDMEEAKLQHVIQQRSKSVKLPSSSSAEGQRSKGGGNVSSTKDDPYPYDSHRKSQSSRELNRSKDGSRNPPGTTTPTPNHHHRVPEKSHHPIKPVSWDNLIGTGTTRSFGGYGYGYGYGYFPTTHSGSGKIPDGHSGPTVTHPHHHNHHSHSGHLCSSNPVNYYKSQGDASKVKVVYNYVAPTYHTILPGSAGHTRTYEPITSQQILKQQLGMGEERSKTLPSAKGSGGGSSSIPKGPPTSQSSAGGFQGAKLERTISDSSLTEPYKEFSVAYFQRSGDNVRFSSEEDFEPHIGDRKNKVSGGVSRRSGSSSRKSPGKPRERIFV